MKHVGARMVALGVGLCLGLAPGTSVARRATLATQHSTTAAAPGEDAGSQVEALNAQAVEQFQAGNYEEAAKLFEQAYQLNPEPNYLFNIGRIYEEMGEPGFPKAIEYYERFVKQPGVEIESRGLAVERLKVLRAIVEETRREEAAAEAAARQEDEPEPSLEPVQEPVVVDEPERTKTPPMRIAGYALLGLGGAVLVTGAIFGGLALQRRNELDELNQLEPRDEAVTAGRRNALVADGMFIAGGVVAATGLVLTLVSLRKKKEANQRASLEPVMSSVGAGARLHVRF